MGTGGVQVAKGRLELAAGGLVLEGVGWVGGGERVDAHARIHRDGDPVPVVDAAAVGVVPVKSGF